MSAPPEVSPAAVLASRLDPSSPEYAADREAMLAALAGVDEVAAKVLEAGGTKYVDRHHARGKLTARERVDLLLDPDAAFLEIGALAGAHEPDLTTPGAGLVVGIGAVSGVECLIVANEPTVKGGSITPIGVTKQLRALEIAERNRLPVIALVESGGADLPRQADLFVPGGRTFRAMTRLSAQGIPTIALVFGSSTAGGAYMPGMSEYTVFVRGQATGVAIGPCSSPCMSQSRACRASLSTEASWSMPPVGAPTKSFSAVRASATQAVRGRSRPRTSFTATSAPLASSRARCASMPSLLRKVQY